MTEQAKVPAIRFAGFTDPWEQRKLGELSSEFQSGDFISAEKILASGPYPVYGGNGLRGYAKRYNHDGFYALIGRQGALCGNVNTAVGKAYFTEHAVAIKANSLHDTRFLAHLLRCMDLGQYSGQSAQPGLAVGVLKEVETTVPSKVEQQAIGSFFSRLDDLITLHQRKYDKLVILKKSMLEKMFPKDGESVPEIRFAGFTDPWEQRKLGDYVVVSTAKNADGRFNKEDVLSVSGEYGIVNQIAFQGRSFAGSSVLNYGIVNTGDIVYTKSPLNSNPYGIIKVNKGIPGIVSTLYAVYRPQDNVHTNFIQVYFEQHERMNNYMHPLVNKGAKNDMKVTAENALKGVVTFPSREEQVIISEFFDRLDSLITLHQRKLELLQNIKKSLLDKMFV